MVAPNPIAPFGIKPSFGQLYGPGGDRLQTTFWRHGTTLPGDVLGRGAIGERGPLLALLDWAQDRGLDVAPLRAAFSLNVTPPAIPLATFRLLIDAVQRECAAARGWGWGLFTDHETNIPIRVLVPAEPAKTLLATPTAAVGISGVGLHLLRRHITLTGWRTTEGGLVLNSRAGEKRIGLTSLSAQLLGLLGGHAGQVELRPVPLSHLLEQVHRTLIDLEVGDGDTSEHVCVTTS
jgi:hypothetical protein